MWYDFLIAGILIFCALRGAQKGFVWQIAGIAGLVLAFVCAETVSPHLMQYLDLGDTLNRWIAMLAVYIGASFVTFAVARSLRKSLEKAKFVEFDRHLGFIFGVLKGGLLAMVVSFFGVTLQTTRPVVLASYSGHASATVLNELKPLLPEELSPYLDPYLDDFEGVENPWDDGLPLLDASAADQAIAADDARRSDADPPAGPVTLDDIRTRFGGYVRDELSRILRGTTEAEGDRILAEVGDADPDDVLAVVDRLAAGLFERPPADDLAPTPTDEPAFDPPSFDDGDFDFSGGSDDFGPAPGLAGGGTPGGDAPIFNSDLRPSFRADGTGADVQDRLREIAVFYNDLPSRQAEFVAEAARRLQNVSADLRARVVADWYADLTGRGSDPEPSTDVATPLLTRIARHRDASARF